MAMVEGKTEMDAMKSDIKIIKKVYACLIAFYVNIPAINAIVTTISSAAAGVFMSFAYIFVVGCFCATFLFQALTRPVKVYLTVLVYILIPIFAFLLTFMIKPHSSVDIVFFALRVVFPLFFMSTCNFDERVFLKATMFIPIIGIFFVDKIFVRIQYDEVISMGLTYAFLPVIIATVVYIARYLGKIKGWSRIVDIIPIAVNIVYGTNVIMYGSRGPILCIGLSIVFLLISTCNKEKGGLVFKTGRTILFGIAVCLLIVYYLEILQAVQDLLNSHNLRFAFVDKILKLSEAGNLNNGRTEHYVAALSGIKKSPIWGNGVAMFEYNTGFVYPHNFLVQLFYDGGIILFSLVIIPLIVGMVKWVKNCTEPQYSMMIMLFFTAVPAALFSGELWTDYALWMTFGYIISFIRRGQSAGNLQEEIDCIKP